jgi:hypothetical protein
MDTMYTMSTHLLYQYFVAHMIPKVIKKRKHSFGYYIVNDKITIQYFCHWKIRKAGRVRCNTLQNEFYPFKAKFLQNILVLEKFKISHVIYQ